MDTDLKKVVVAGGSGFIGRKIVRALLDRGYKVTVMDLHQAHYDLGPNSVNYEFIKKNLAKEMVDHKIVAGAYGVINVTGEGVFQRWTHSIRKKIVASRSHATNNIVDACLKTMRHPRVIVSASAGGIYGDTGNKEVDEMSPAGEGFLSEVCRSWEGALAPLQITPVRIVIIRMTMVLGHGGFLAALKKIMKTGFAPILGSGEQYISWIHIDDLVKVYIQALENENMRGPVNAASPNYVKQKDFIKIYAGFLKNKIFVHIPEFFITTFFGPRAHLTLDSQKVMPRKLIQTGFNYKFKYLEEALSDIEE